MSPDLERRLQDAWEALPLPSASATSRARDAVLGRRRRFRRALPFALALALASAGGLAAGRSLAPAAGPALPSAAVGFVPAAGWTVLQTGNDATPQHPARALAANVPIHPDDEPHRLPLRTLQSLPRDGIVIVARFTALPDGSPAPAAGQLPLRVADARPEIQFSAEVRPQRPLGQFQLHRTVGGYRVDLHLYFGSRQPSAGARAEAQRQLDRLLVAGPAAGVRERRLAAVAPPAVQSAVCPRYAPNVKLTFGPTGPVYPGQERPTARSRFASVHTDGVTRRGGHLAYLRATAVTREIDAVCTPVRLRPNPSAARLGPRYVHRLTSDGVGWFVAPDGFRLIHPNYNCVVGGRIVVHSSALRDDRRRVVGNRFSVRLERTNELLAVAELRPAGPTWFRVSNRCTQTRY
ncbi:MAG TPA: hypothetical protein VM290_03305 [Gaiellaceae bacterium]|nr:hypothetical protein [Gaiellaceae bacterium]